MQPRDEERSIVRNVCANMQAEGFRVTAATQKQCKEIASGKTNADALIKRRLAAYTQNERG